MNVIRKIETTTKTNGTFTMDFQYDQKLKYPLPQKIIFSFNVGQLNLPQMVPDDAGSETSKKKKRINSTTKGTVEVNYSNYVVNKGIEDSIFDDNKSKIKK